MHQFGCLKMIFKTIQITLKAYIDQNHKLMVQKAFFEVRKACLPYVVEASSLLVKAHVVHERHKSGWMSTSWILFVFADCVMLFGIGP